jgi:hypothetical protein
MTRKTQIGQDRPDVPVKTDRNRQLLSPHSPGASLCQQHCHCSQQKYHPTWHQPNRHRQTSSEFVLL